MMTVTERRNLAREAKQAISTYLLWLDPNLRDTPGALGARNDALLQAKRKLALLTADHGEELRALLASGARNSGGERRDRTGT